MSKIDEAIEKISKQQESLNKYTNASQLGEQLKNICRESENTAELVSTDLDNPKMSITECEKKIKARCDEIHKEIKGSGVALPIDEAEAIIREFYGLGAAEESEPQDAQVFDFADFLED